MHSWKWAKFAGSVQLGSPQPLTPSAAYDPLEKIMWPPLYTLSSRVILSVCHKPVLYRNDWTNRVIFSMGLFPPISTLCCKEIWVSLKIRVLPVGTLPRQVDPLVNKTRRLRRRRSSLLTNRGCLQVDQLQPLTPLRRFAVWICCCRQLVSTVDKIFTDIARRQSFLLSH